MYPVVTEKHLLGIIASKYPRKLPPNNASPLHPARLSRDMEGNAPIAQVSWHRVARSDSKSPRTRRKRPCRSTFSLNDVASLREWGPRNGRHSKAIREGEPLHEQLPRPASRLRTREKLVANLPAVSPRTVCWSAQLSNSFTRGIRMCRIYRCHDKVPSRGSLTSYRLCGQRLNASRLICLPDLFSRDAYCEGQCWSSRGVLITGNVNYQREVPSKVNVNGHCVLLCLLRSSKKLSFIKRRE